MTLWQIQETEDICLQSVVDIAVDGDNFADRLGPRAIESRDLWNLYIVFEHNVNLRVERPCTWMSQQCDYPSSNQSFVALIGWLWRTCVQKCFSTLPSANSFVLATC